MGMESKFLFFDLATGRPTNNECVTMLALNSRGDVQYPCKPGSVNNL